MTTGYCITRRTRNFRSGIAIILSMIFIVIFTAMAIAMASMSATNLQITENHHSSNVAFGAAQSGIECGKYLIANANLLLPSTGDNVITTAQANSVWTTLCTYVQSTALDGQTVPAATRFTDSYGSGDQFITQAMNYGTVNSDFTIRFYRYDNDAITIRLQSTGTNGDISRKIAIDMKIGKQAEVLKYAIASKTRVWLTGDSTIHGNIYSSWKYQHLSPFNITSDSTVEGTIGTILTNINPTTGEKGPDLYAGTTLMPYNLETLDDDGNPVYDSEGNKVISPTDEIQGQSEGINYNVNYGDKAANMPGMKLSDYDTSSYKAQTTALSTTGIPTVTEYFPHNAGDYTHGPSGSLRLTRYKYTDQTFTNIKVLSNKNALFQNCTFNDILYIDCGQSGTGYYNNVRFENCVFNGPIVTNTLNYSFSDSTTWWKKNCLYFTGEETFQNNTDVPATILAPNFNVNLGNTNPNSGENNVLTGAIVGGIVDIRGNAEIYGTVISMYDTSGYSSGYVSNIGATLDDGGSETTEPGDIGTINITPNETQMLPSGIITPIVITLQQQNYSEPR